MRYKITVERIEPHPKAGEEIPRSRYNNGGWDQPTQVYADTFSSIMLTAELNESEYKACKRAIIEAKE